MSFNTNTFKQTPDCKSLKIEPLATLRYTKNGNKLVIPDIFKVNGETNTLSLSTESNNDVGIYQFHIDYALPAPSNTNLKVLNARVFQIEILKRPLFAPFFEKPLDSVVTATINELLSYELPPYVKYDRDDESIDTVVITIVNPSAEDKDSISEIQKYITYDKESNKLDIKPFILTTDEMTEDDLQEIKLTLVGRHSLNVVLTEVSTGLTTTNSLMIEVLDKYVILEHEVEKRKK